MARQAVTTPAGVAVYPRLSTADTKFDKRGVYSVKLRLEGEAAAGLMAKIAAWQDFRNLNVVEDPLILVNFFEGCLNSQT